MEKVLVKIVDYFSLPKGLLKEAKQIFESNQPSDNVEVLGAVSVLLAAKKHDHIIEIKEIRRYLGDNFKLFNRIFMECTNQGRSVFVPEIEEILQETFSALSIPPEYFDEALYIYFFQRTRPVRRHAQARAHAVVASFLAAKKHDIILDKKQMKEYLGASHSLFPKLLLSYSKPNEKDVRVIINELIDTTGKNALIAQGIDEDQWVEIRKKAQIIFKQHEFHLIHTLDRVAAASILNHAAKSLGVELNQSALARKFDITQSAIKNCQKKLPKFHTRNKWDLVNERITETHFEERAFPKSSENDRDAIRKEALKLIEQYKDTFTFARDRTIAAASVMYAAKEMGVATNAIEISQIFAASGASINRQLKELPPILIEDIITGADLDVLEFPKTSHEEREAIRKAALIFVKNNAQFYKKSLQRSGAASALVMGARVLGFKAIASEIAKKLNVVANTISKHLRALSPAVRSVEGISDAKKSKTANTQ